MGPLRKFWKAWKRFGETMAHKVGTGIFAVLYVIVFAPVALFFKITGKKFLPHFTGKESTYFLPKEKIEPTLKYMERQW